MLFIEPKLGINNAKFNIRLEAEMLVWQFLILH